MKRLYYIAEDIETTHHVSETLRSECIPEWRLHVVARDEAGLAAYDVHSATLNEQLDLVHTGERGALAGALVGLLVALACLGLSPLGWSPDLASATVLVLAGTVVGAWQGGLVGLSRENYRLEPFHDDLAAGRYLVMVDVRPEEAARIEFILATWFPQVRAGGAGSPWTNPFVSAGRVHAQNTH